MVGDGKAQRLAHAKWAREEGGIERPTHLDTLLQPEQQARIQWLREHCLDAISILDLGCSWGYVLSKVGGRDCLGIDISGEAIQMARQHFPGIGFLQADITKELPSRQFDVVILSEVLEHLDWADVPTLIVRVKAIAKVKILITLPWREDEKCRYCFKHRWIPTRAKVKSLVKLLCPLTVGLVCDGHFMYMEATW